MKLMLVTANILIPLAVLIFATGFFPYKPFIPGLASHDDFANHGISGQAPQARFDKIIFMVVDALRSDFVFSSASGFAHVQKLIRSGDAIPFTAHASSPTITMPKVKAITTGSVPSFLDVILNFAESDTTSTLATQDTWLAQIRAGHDRRGDGRLIMYGDDTWLKLFPQTFTRSEGTSSFFVSDFTEVDNNVTRHIPAELANSDWDAMFMHYLGLDHIGHKAGPLSPNMLPKQQEMDSIVESIFTAITTLPHLNSTMLVLCGDHGMTDGGNHGGSSSGETSPALVFAASKLKHITDGLESPAVPQEAYNFYAKVDQSDLAPTISSLMGHPIPKNNVGVVIPQFLELWSEDKDKIELLTRNALQMLSIVKATFPTQDFDVAADMMECKDFTSDAQALACKWAHARSLSVTHRSSETSAEASVTALYSFLRHAQEVMSSTASNYDLGRLTAGIVLMATAFVLTCIASATSPSFYNADVALLSSVVTLYSIMMFASSYVEEEQQFWYWIAGGWIAYLRLTTLQRQYSNMKGSKLMNFHGTIAIISLHRVIQRWNQTGQKHAGSPDIITTFLSHRPAWMWSLVIFAYGITSLQVSYSVARYLRLGFGIGAISSLFLSVPSLVLKLVFIASDAPELLSFISSEQLEALRQLAVVPIARFFFGVLAALSIIAGILIHTAQKNRPERKAILHTFFSLLIMLLLTQSRTHNIPLFLFFIVQHKFLQNLRLSPIKVSINTFIMAHVSFFALGNSNAISSVDLSNGYNGVSGYNVMAVGLLVFISNWAGPIFWSMSGIVLLSQSNQTRTVTKDIGSLEQSKEDPCLAHLTVNTLFISASTLAMMIACTVLRTHLFIWTVFSPKYLYTMAWSLGYHYLVTLALGGGLWRLTNHLK